MADGTPGNAASAWLPPASSAPAARGTVFGASGAPLAPPTGAARDGAAPAPPVARRRDGWTPPPRRGLVPLRPIPFGAVLGAPFRLQRRAPRTTLAPALVVSLVATVSASVLGWALTVGPRASLDASYYQDFLVADALLGVIGAAASFVPFVLALGATALLGGLVAVATARAVLAERVSWRGALWRLHGRIPRLVGWSAIVLLAAAVLLVVGTLLPLSAAFTPYAGSVLAGTIAFFELIVVVLVGGYLAARLGFTTHAIALEGLRLGPAIARSWRLTRRAGWRLWSSHLAVWFAVLIASWVLVQPVTWALDGGANLLFPNGWTIAQQEGYLAVRTVVVTVVVAVTGAFGLVLQTVTGALLYLDQRMRAEGLDLALARYVDERQRGDAPSDPFPPGGAR